LVCFISLATKQDNPWWIPSLWIHSLLAMFARFPTPPSFFGPGKDNVDRSVGSSLLIFLLLFIPQKNGPSDALRLVLQPLVIVVISTRNRSPILLTL
jgi:hypothetical protein